VENLEALGKTAVSCAKILLLFGIRAIGGEWVNGKWAGDWQAEVWHGEDAGHSVQVK